MRRETSKKQSQPVSLQLSVIILTLNEEHNLPGALESVRDWAESVFIVDSCSTDRTVDVALEYGAGVVQRPFTNYSDQWNWALEHLPVETPWILKLDADERISKELSLEIEERLSAEGEEAGFDVRVRLWFMGKPLHTTINLCRLWRKDKGRFSNVIVNEHLQIDGTVGQLKNYIEHMDSPNLHRWYEKQNRYTTMEAIMRLKDDQLAAQPKLFGTRLERRMFLKKIFYRIPFRYQLYWLYEAFVRGAIRDGAAGLTWVHLRVEVHRAIEMKTKEMRNTGHIPEIPIASHGDYDPRVLASSLQKAVCGVGDEKARYQ